MSKITVLGAGAWAAPLSEQPGGLFVGDAERRQPRSNMAVPHAEVTR